MSCVPCRLTAQDCTLPPARPVLGVVSGAHQKVPQIEAWRGPFGGFGGPGKLGLRDDHFVPRCSLLQRLQTGLL